MAHEACQADGTGVSTQVRVEQVLASAPQLLVCFRLSQLLGFYAETVVQLAGPGAALVATLQTAQARCLLVGCLAVACLEMFTAMALQLLHDMPASTNTKLLSAGSSNPRLQGGALAAGGEAGTASTATADRPVAAPTGAASVAMHRTARQALVCPSDQLQSLAVSTMV
jgi:Conserved oligomeric complex COG6